MSKELKEQEQVSNGINFNDIINKMMDSIDTNDIPVEELARELDVLAIHFNTSKEILGNLMRRAGSRQRFAFALKANLIAKQIAVEEEMLVKSIATSMDISRKSDEVRASRQNLRQMTNAMTGRSNYGLPGIR